MAHQRTARARLQGAGFDRILPYVLLAPAVLLVLAVVVYPLISGVQTSRQFYRFGSAISNVGFDQYRQALEDPLFTGALWTTVKFVTAAVVIETVLGMGLALLCLRELPFIRAMRLMLIVPMVVTPVVVGIVFRLIYASDVGLLSALSGLGGGGSVRILDSESRAFWGLVLLDVWEWTPLIFLILLAGLQSLPQEPFEAARVDGAGAWRTFVDHTLPMVAPVLVVAVVLRTIDAFTTFDQVYVLTHGGPGTATQLISIYGYDTFFRFQQYGYAAAMLLMVALVVLACAFLAVRLMRRQATTA
ncbi:MAG: multiple sugar transport system permease protein [Gaiellales bacterium]|jgi:multiple sugar transport system permease protein|nr:multiple sugar transport system permease protein [Gaiellales bacterium]